MSTVKTQRRNEHRRAAKRKNKVRYKETHADVFKRDMDRFKTTGQAGISDRRVVRA